MRCVAISDTHNKALHKVPYGDVLIHAGDATNLGTESEVRAFVKWFAHTLHPHHVFVPGNHDWLFQKEPDVARRIMQDAGVHVLIDESVVLDGVHFYGSPWQPEFCGWAFNLSRVSGELGEAWSRIPDDTDVLVTHGPPMGILDMVGRRGDLGCWELRERVRKLKLKAHVFGHIHYSYGEVVGVPTKYYNVAVCNESYELANKPTEFDI